MKWLVACLALSFSACAHPRGDGRVCTFDGASAICPADNDTVSTWKMGQEGDWVCMKIQEYLERTRCE